jgi:broad specificity phosphatase PhoE
MIPPKRENSTILYVIRHGQTTWNRENKVQGQLDVPLDEVGEKQAAALAQRLTGQEIDKLYSSDLLRASRTAEIIAGILNLPVGIKPALRERNWGDWQGKTMSELGDRLWQAGYKPEGGETRLNQRERVLNELDNIIATHKGGRVGIVTHGGCNRIILTNALGLDMFEPYPFHNINCCLSIFEVKDGLWKTWTINETAHLNNI